MPFDPDFDYDDVTESDTKPALAWVLTVGFGVAVVIFTAGVVCGVIFG